MAATCSGHSHPSTRAALTLGNTLYVMVVHVLSAAVTCHAALCQAASLGIARHTLVDRETGASVLQIYSESPKTHQAAQRPDHSWCSQDQEVRLQACRMPAAATSLHRALFQAYMGCSQAVSACKQAREHCPCRLQVPPLGNGSGCVWLPNQGTCRAASELQDTMHCNMVLLVAAGAGPAVRVGLAAPHDQYCCAGGGEQDVSAGTARRPGQGATCAIRKQHGLTVQLDSAGLMCLAHAPSCPPSHLVHRSWCCWLSIATCTATCCALCCVERGPCLPQMKLLFAMLNEPPWCFFPLTVQLLSSEWLPLQAKCLQPPAHVRVDAAAMEVSS